MDTSVLWPGLCMVKTCSFLLDKSSWPKKKPEEVPMCVGICHVFPWEEAKSPSAPSALCLMALGVYFHSRGKTQYLTLPKSFHSVGHNASGEHLSQRRGGGCPFRELDRSWAGWKPVCVIPRAASLECPSQGLSCRMKQFLVAVPLSQIALLERLNHCVF